MAKKKKRYKKRRAPKVYSRSCDIHHICYIRRSWNSGYPRKIRDHPYFKISIPRDTLHRMIHSELKEIPVPSELAAKSAYEQILLLENYCALHYGDPIEKRLSILIAIFDCSAQETADGFRKQLEIVHEFRRLSM